jgi:hypothetical protein
MMISNCAQDAKQRDKDLKTSCVTASPMKPIKCGWPNARKNKQHILWLKVLYHGQYVHPSKDKKVLGIEKAQAPLWKKKLKRLCDSPPATPGVL